MRLTAICLVVTGTFGLAACAELGDAEVGGSSEELLTTMPPVTTTPTPQLAWHMYEYGTSDMPDRLIPAGCRYFATLYSQKSRVVGGQRVPVPGKFTVYGVCTRPTVRFAWAISGKNADFGKFEGDLAEEIEDFGFDLGTGSNGVITKLGPRGPGPQPGLPLLTRVVDAALELDADFEAGWPSTSGFTARGIVVGPSTGSGPIVIGTPTTTREVCLTDPGVQIPDDCDSFVTVVAKKATDDGSRKIKVSGVCGRPSGHTIEWNRIVPVSKLSCIKEALGNEVATQAGLNLDFGYGGNGVITKLGPRGPGPQPGVPENILDQAARIVLHIEERWLVAVAGPEVCLPEDFSCTIPNGP
jgi:hypothetical protein